MSDTKSKLKTRKPGEFRLPLIKTLADVEALSHLSKEEKAVAVENFTRIPPSDGYYMMGNDPDLQSFWRLMEMEITSLLFPDHQGVPFGPMNLITLEVARHSGNDYLLGFMQHVTANTIGDFDKPYDNYQKLGMLENADSAMWTDEERMIIKFTRACLESKMTDELFEQARAAWGEKKLLRYIAWVAFVQQWGTLQSALDMKFLPETMSFPRGIMGPEAVGAAVSKLKDTKDKVREFWNTLQKPDNRM
ncbi:MAG: hypothetical protein HKP58_06050 [Desulfatitalea sp.]|nr:hypothetical protein [Desulfatitalea sp.]NNJ99958.1 hypothetical protein [Desulfatitalea sp.]